ncbi:hypothetical protein BC826DRAFT_1032169 [Russula brevipes]|nr:hypothetical protein BC826DRAFT_1032169 [Russula brevipes]
MYMEAHPFELLFCDHCGDFFARQDALDRHRRNPHGMFMERLEHCLKTNEDIGVPFSQIIKAIFPESSKRGSRQQSRLTAGTSQPP